MFSDYTFLSLFLIGCIMSKLLRALVGVITLVILFVLWWWFGEKNGTTGSVGFVTQSVNSNEDKAVRKESWKLSLLVFPNDTTNESIWSDPATKEVKCPGAAQGEIKFSIPPHTDVTMYNKEWNEVNTFWFQLSMIAQNNQVPGKLLKAILGKNPFDTDKCVYKTDDGKLVILSIKLADEFNALTPDGMGFMKN